MKEIDLNALPAYSKWPAILLGLEPYEPKIKTVAEVVREFEVEKWSAVLAKIRAEPGLQVTEIDAWRLQALEVPIYERGRFFITSAMEALNRQLRCCADEISSFAKNAAPVTELGAGYGSVLLNLAKKDCFSCCSFYAAEFTPSGIDSIRILARNQGIDVPVGYCDLREMKLEDLIIPPGSIIYTSFALPYVREVPDEFPEYFARFSPTAVIHFEPCYEHCDATSVFGMMCQRYIQINGYNTNLVTVLKKSSAKGKIEILKEEPAVFGANPLLPMSIIAWRPIVA